jgi:hypothetical protein
MPPPIWPAPTMPIVSILLITPIPSKKAFAACFLCGAN